MEFKTAIYQGICFYIIRYSPTNWETFNRTKDGIWFYDLDLVEYAEYSQSLVIEWRDIWQSMKKCIMSFIVADRI